jgi:hypothetical protein
VKAYFELQYKILSRRFRDAGIPPLAAGVFLTAAFVGFSVYLFNKTEFAVPVYLLTALSVTGKLSDISRNDFLRICFGDKKVKKIRVIENLFIIAPFLIFLLYKQLFPAAVILVVPAIILALLNFRTTLNLVIPTPFYKKPFEFTTGFRNTFYVIAAAYVLTVIAVLAANFNLGIFAMLLVFTVTAGYYLKPENEYYVWIYRLNAKKFLMEKIKTALLYSSFLVLPVALLLGIFFRHNITALLLFMLAGWLFIIAMIVSKYAAYPDELNILQGILLALCIGFPPLLILLIPYLFQRSVSRLNRLLQ